MWFWQNLENWIQLATFHKKLQYQEFWWFWKRWGRRIFVESRTFKCEGERNDLALFYELLFGNVFERKDGKYCAVLMKYCRKVNGEQVISHKLAQQLKTKNINVVPGQLFCRQCKANFLLETESLYWWSR